MAMTIMETTVRTRIINFDALRMIPLSPLVWVGIAPGRVSSPQRTSTVATKGRQLRFLSNLLS